MCYKELPEGYTELDKIDLQNNKKQFWLVQLISALIGIILIVAGCFLVNPYTAIKENPTVAMYAIAACLIGMVVYIILHELTHGVFLWAFTKVKPRFGFVGWAAYCGNSGYCDKPRYLVVALSPLIIWGIVFAVLNVFFHSDIWFWLIWMLQIINVSGAAGDLFVSGKMHTYPKDILVQDTGLAMTVFGIGQPSAQGAEESAEKEGEQATEEPAEEAKEQKAEEAIQQTEEKHD